MLPLETDDAALSAELVCGDVELEVAEPECFACSRCGHDRAPRLYSVITSVVTATCGSRKPPEHFHAPSMVEAPPRDAG
jgi:hypothetical protein